MTPTVHAAALWSGKFQQKEDSIMEQIFIIAALWLRLAVLSAVVAYHLRVSIA